MEKTFGDALKEWRGRRRMSQLDLGLAANVSARHISFLETGRARPSRAMVLQLSEQLGVPRTARNGLLNAAGFAPAYRARNLAEADMAPVRDAIAWMLERHDPYPAMALDRHWRLVRMNRAATGLLAAIGVGEGDSLLDVMADAARMKPHMENWAEVAQHMTARLRTESAHLGGDPVLDKAADRLSAELGAEAPHAAGTLPPVVPARFRAGDVTLSLMSTIAQFGTAEDITLADLKIEMMFPADEATRDVLAMLDADAQQADETV